MFPVRLKSLPICGVEDVRAYQVHLVQHKVASASLNQIVSALRFVYGVTLGRKDLRVRIPYARVPKTLPVVLSVAEVTRLIEALAARCPSWKPKVRLVTAMFASADINAADMRLDG